VSGYFRRVIIFVSLCGTALSLASSVFAQSAEEMDILQMIYKDKDLVTPTRSAKPISQVAENITVVTADEIELLNAHTLSEVLYRVTGVQVDVRGGPGTAASPLIQGSDPRHVQVRVDGVSLNNLADNFANIGAFPVQQIERIEIIKGPASSAWGSSLGGIINIITRSPDPDRRFGGTASAAMGEQTTGDFRADISGTADNLGYYLYGGGLTSDGLTPNTPVDMGNLYTKLQWQATRDARVQFSLAYNKGSRGDGQDQAFDFAFKEDFETFFTTLALNYTFSDTLSLDLSGRVSKKRLTQFVNQLSSGAELNSIATDDFNTGGSAKLAWRSGMHNALVGAECDNGTLETAAILGGRQRQAKWAVFANDTLAMGDFSVTPGVRYDHTHTNGDFVSPSLGVTYTPMLQTILRAYVTRGFSTPPLSFTFGDGFFTVPNPDLNVEKVWSYSLGLETALHKYAWLKATGFLHDINDVITFAQLPDGPFTAVNSGRQRRRGIEVELKTVPVYHTSLLAGYILMDVSDRQTSRRIPNFPTYTYDLGIDYNDNDTLRGALRGHYIWWNADGALHGRYRALIWDLNFAKKIIEKGNSTAELFFTAHNLFNGSQYLDGLFPNPRRWFEGGIRVKF